jgi:hypothetical protein
MSEATTTSSGLSATARVEQMATAASNWLASLSTDQRRKATFGFPENDERTLWYYTPTDRGGLTLSEMEPLQQRLAHRLIASGLSFGGYVTVATIMGIENVLDAVEGWRTNYPGRGYSSRGRDPQLYFVSIFGTPGEKSWGWRVGGHHVSISYTIVDGVIASPTPLFFGSNPAETHQVGPSVLRPLAGEEDLGRDLLRALDADQRATAILAPVAPRDIVQSNRPKVEDGALPRGGQDIFGQIPREEISRFQGIDDAAHNRRPDPRADADRVASAYAEFLRFSTAPKGLAAARMNASQQELLGTLIRQYVGRLPDDLVELLLPRVTGSVLDAMHFAWAGGFEHRQPHYYRIQGPHLLIEYDCTQDNANHIHAVWRDPEDDFGYDLLAQHYHHHH